jgi:hypothetical protein
LPPVAVLAALFRWGALWLAVLSAPPARARPRVVELSCQIGRHRTGVLVPRSEEDDSDDELDCRAVVSGVGPRGQLAAELRVLPPAGPYRVVASGPLERADDDPGQARLDQLVVPHSTWASGVDWRNTQSPRARLELRVYSRGAAHHPAWRLLATRRLDIGAWPRPRH